MHNHTIAVALAITLVTQLASAQSTEPASSESRDAATAYVGTINFIVGRVGRDCLSLLGRSELPQQFAGAWQQRNAKYVAAAAKYLERRLEEASASGGPEKRDAVLREVTTAVHSSGENTVRSWLERGDKQEACKRAVALVEAGGLDISANSPMFSELEALAAWAR
jgi:hypothetical protein